MKKIFVNDFSMEQLPHGGSEKVNDYLFKELGCDEFVNSRNFYSFPVNKDNFYIISNISLCPNWKDKMWSLASYGNYIIIEHDYKICASRHPWRYEKNVVPKQDRIPEAYEFYRMAKAVVVQTTDHLNIMGINDVKANWINAQCSIWSPENLDLLDEIREFVLWRSQNSFAILNSTNWIKNTTGAIEFCKQNNLNFKLLDENKDYYHFLLALAAFPALVFFPIARETCCRFVVEAKALDMNVITSKNYGASLSDWFNLYGKNMTNYLRDQSAKTVEEIKKYIP